MKKAFILKGLPASGKTTWAREYLLEFPTFTIVNNDTIRKQYMEEHDIDNWSFTGVETHVNDIRTDIIKSAAKNDQSVIVDNTHLNPKAFNEIESLLKSLDYDIEVVEFMDNVDECVRRDKKRPKGQKVGEDVIRRMHEQHILKIPKKKKEKKIMNRKLPIAVVTNDKPSCLIVDIDGTLADMNGRYPFDITTVYDDVPRLHVVTAVTSLKLGLPILDILVFSGRSDASRDDTIRWLTDKCGFFVDNGTDFYEKYPDIYNEDFFRATYGIAVELHMRPHGDSRSDVIIKREMFESTVTGRYNVFAVFDDRPSVVRMWAEMNLPVFNCGVIDEEF